MTYVNLMQLSLLELLPGVACKVCGVGWWGVVGCVGVVWCGVVCQHNVIMLLFFFPLFSTSDYGNQAISKRYSRN